MRGVESSVATHLEMKMDGRKMALPMLSPTVARCGCHTAIAAWSLVVQGRSHPTLAWRRRWKAPTTPVTSIPTIAPTVALVGNRKVRLR